MVLYFTEDCIFKFKNKRFTSNWLKAVATKEGKVLGNISIIFCSDTYILKVNEEYLKHNYYTDIITFNYCEANILSGDLFISIDTVKANAIEYNVTFEEELNRVIVHGILHLIGYDDHSGEDKIKMREKENYYLKFRQSLYEV